eukprot:COSAG01_NODE_59523_length_299_cov_40.115000_1_plen_33_part_01
MLKSAKQEFGSGWDSHTIQAEIPAEILATQYTT